MFLTTRAAAIVTRKTPGHGGETMTRGSYEYSLAELIEHPVIRLVMESDGVDRRSLNLLLDDRARDFRNPPSWHEEPVNT